LLLDLDRPGEALKAFESSLMESPNRFNSLAGAFAAERSRQRDKAADYYRTLLKQVDKESNARRFGTRARFSTGCDSGRDKPSFSSPRHLSDRSSRTGGA
jgi:hypothetical protein